MTRGRSPLPEGGVRVIGAPPPPTRLERSVVGRAVFSRGWDVGDGFEGWETLEDSPTRGCSVTRGRSVRSVTGLRVMDVPLPMRLGRSPEGRAVFRRGWTDGAGAVG